MTRPTDEELDDFSNIILLLEEEFRHDLSVHLYSAVLLNQINPKFPNLGWTRWPLDASKVPDPRITAVYHDSYGKELVPEVDKEQLKKAEDLVNERYIKRQQAKAQQEQALYERAVKKGIPRTRGKIQELKYGKNRKKEHKSSRKRARDALVSDSDVESDYDQNNEHEDDEDDDEIEDDVDNDSISDFSEPEFRPSTRELLDRISKTERRVVPNAKEDMLEQSEINASEYASNDSNSSDSDSDLDSNADEDTRLIWGPRFRFSKLKFVQKPTDHKAELLLEMKALIQRTIRDRIKDMKSLPPDCNIMADFDNDVTDEMSKLLCYKVDNFLQTVSLSFTKSTSFLNPLDWQDMFLADVKNQSPIIPSKNPKLYYERCEKVFINPPYRYEYNDIEVSRNVKFKINEYINKFCEQPYTGETLKSLIVQKNEDVQKVREFKRNLFYKALENRDRAMELSWNKGFEKVGQWRDPRGKKTNRGILTEEGVDLTDYAARYRGMRLDKHDYLVDF